MGSLRTLAVLAVLVAGCGAEAPPPAAPLASDAPPAPAPSPSTMPAASASASAPAPAPAPAPAATMAEDTAAVPKGHVAALPGKDAAAFLVRYAAARGKTISREDATAYFETLDKKLPVDLPPFPPKARCLACDPLSVYRADANNDGKVDYLLVTKNSVSSHNDTIVSVLTIADGKAAETNVPDEPPFKKSITFFDGLFVDDKGTTLLVEPAIQKPPLPKKVPQYLWKDGAIKKVGEIERPKS